jgi:hypothetical protein
MLLGLDIGGKQPQESGAKIRKEKNGVATFFLP